MLDILTLVSSPKLRYSIRMNRWDTYFSEGKSFQPVNEIFLDLLLKDIRGEIGREPNSVIDLGCGEGDAVVKFARRGLNTLGLDNSKIGLDHATQAIINAKLSHAKVQLANLETFSISEHYDIAFCRLTIAFINDKKSFLEKTHLLLNDRGAFILITPVTYPNVEYLKVDKPEIAVDFETVKKMLSEHFHDVRVWHHDYFAEHGDTITFLAK